MAPRKRGALSQQQFNQLTSNLLDLNTGSVGLPFTDTKINIPSAAPLGMLMELAMLFIWNYGRKNSSRKHSK